MSPTTLDAARTGAAPRPVWRLAVDRRFGPFFWGALVSNTGTWLQSMSAILLVYDLTGSATAVGVVTAAQYSGYLVFAPIAGHLADRFDRRRMLLAMQTVGLLGAAGLVVAVADGTPGALPIYLGVAVTGAAQALSVPVIHALVPSLVPAQDLPGAVALQSLTYNFSRAVGPAVGAATLVALGPVVTFGLNAASYLVMLAGLAVTRPATARVVAVAGRATVSAVRYLRRHRSVAAKLLVVGAVSFAVDAVNTLAAPVVHRLDLGDTSVGLLVSAFGLGAAVMVVCSVWVIRRIGDTVATTAGLIVLAAAMVGFGTAPNLLLIAAVLAVGGAGFVLGQTALTTSIQRVVPEAVRGRVMAVWAILFLGTRPLAALVNGGLADLAGTRVAVLVPAAALLAGTVITARRTPTPPPAGQD